MVNARETAVNILISVLKDGAYSNISVNSELKKSGLGNEDKGLATALVYGVLDRKITLDYIISKYVKNRVDKIKPVALNALRIGLYQIIYMDKIPQSAAVNESVNIVKRSKERYAASFVNGVLRTYLRQPCELPTGNDPKSLGVKYSCPEWIVNGFITDYGLETAVALLQESLKKPPVYLRVNTLKTDMNTLIKSLENEGITAEPTDTENALVVTSTIDVSASKGYKDGHFHIEDTASQKMIASIGLSENIRVLDICSAPGGKAFTMAQYLNNTGEITACDLYEHRVNLIKSGAERLGIKNIKTIVNDATVFNRSLGLFDVVLCDVPCSGLGVIRRKPEIKYKSIKDEEYRTLLEIQRKILDTAVGYLKTGGKLVYSTCTLKKDENEGQITAFLDKHPDYGVKCSVNYMAFKDGTDGFFSAVLYKKR